MHLFSPVQARGLLAFLLMWGGLSLWAGAQPSRQLDSLRQQWPRLTDSSFVRTSLHIASFHLAYHQTDSAAFYLDTAQAVAQRLGLDLYETIALDMQGQTAGLAGAYARSILHHQAAARRWEARGDSLRLGISLNNMGNSYLRINDFDQALACYLRSLRLTPMENEAHNNTGTLLNIGLVYRSLERPRLALSYLQRALHLADSLHERLPQVGIYMSLASTYMDLGQPDSARIYGESGLDLARHLGHAYHQQGALIDLAHHSVEAGRYAAAQGYLDAFQAGQAAPDPKRDLYWQNYQAEVWWHTGRRPEALALAQQGLTAAEAMGDAVSLSNAHEQLYRFYEAMGQGMDALRHHQAYQAWQDSLFAAEQQLAIQRLEVAYETEKTEAELLRWRQVAQIEALRVRQRNLGILLLLAVFGVLGGWLFFRHRNRLLAEQLQRLETEQRLRRSQTNPHFFFHALNGIQQYILLEPDPGKAVRYLSRLARLMREVLLYSRSDFIRLDQELHTLTTYIELQQLRYPGQFSYELAVAPDLEPELWTVPPLLLQPMVENAIEHGLAPRSGPGHLRLAAAAEGDTLRLEVEDDGVGREAAPSGEGMSLATQLIRERLSLLQQQGLGTGELLITDLHDGAGQPAGTRVRLRLALKAPLPASLP